jgi:hypothetical protein
MRCTILHATGQDTRRSKGHHCDWIDACGGALASSNFEHGARLTEIILLGNVARTAKLCGRRGHEGDQRPGTDQYLKETYGTWEAGVGSTIYEVRLRARRTRPRPESVPPVLRTCNSYLHVVPLFRAPVPPTRLPKVLANLPSVLVDHAHLERKAATSA